MTVAEQKAQSFLESGENLKTFLKRHATTPPEKKNALWLLRYLDKGLYLSGHVHRTSHHYSHEHTVALDISMDTDEEFQENAGLLADKAFEALESGMKEHILELCKQFYKILEKDHDYLNSDEAVAETLDANEYYFDPESGESVEFESGMAIQHLKPDVQRRVIDGFKDLVMRDDNSVLAYIHDKGIRFRSGGQPVPKPDGVKISEIGDSNIQDKILNRYRDINTHDDWYESTIEWCDTYLEALGFENPEINFSGFSNQGDGASFTCQSIDFQKYLNSLINPIKMGDV